MTHGTADDGSERRTDSTMDSTTDNLPAREQRLTDRGEPYARATVVRREPPVSANVGDRAIVMVDGTLYGWVGGASCAQSRVVSEAQSAIADGEPRLIGLASDPADVDRPGLDAFPMTCHSEGTLEVFIEPVIPATRLLVVGDSPIAHSLARLATELSMAVTLVDPDGTEEALPDATTLVTTLDPKAIADAVGTAPFVVVASMGKYDARGVAAGLLAEAPYIGLVASTTRSAAVVERAAGLVGRDPEAVRDAVTSPAGLDIGAHTAPEIATSLLAELVEVRANAGAVTAVAESCDGHEASDNGHDGHEASDHDSHRDADEPHVDPVCGMTVDPSDAPSVTHDGESYYFCCPGCADTFRADPEEYLDASESQPTGAR